MPELADIIDPTLEVSGGTTLRRAALTGAVTAAAGSNTTALAANAVVTASIADANVTAAKLASDAVTTAKILDANVTTAKIADLNVTTGKLADTAVTTAKVTDANITYAKIQNVSATDRILGRSTAGAGVIEEIACTAAGRDLVAGANAAAQRTSLGLGSLATLSAVPDEHVTYARMQHVSAASRLLGRGSAGGAGDVEEITLGTGLSMSGTTLSSSGGSPWRLPDHFLVPAWTGNPFAWMRGNVNVSAGSATVSNSASGDAFTAAFLAGYSTAFNAANAQAGICFGMNTGQTGPFYIEDGFRVHIVFATNSTNALATHRHFAGLAGGAPSTAHVSTTSTIEDKVNIVGVGKRASDTNMRSFNNDGSGTATSADLGANYPETGAILYEFRAYCAAAADVSCSLKNWNSGNTTTWTVSTDMPADNEPLNIVVGCNSGTVGTGGEAVIFVHKIEAWLGDWLVAA